MRRRIHANLKKHLNVTCHMRRRIHANLKKHLNVSQVGNQYRRKLHLHERGVKIALWAKET
jgi:hypothetical protein